VKYYTLPELPSIQVEAVLPRLLHGASEFPGCYGFGLKLSCSASSTVY